MGIIVGGCIGPIKLRDLRPFKRLASPESWRPQRMTAAELFTFVRDAVAGQIFLSHQVVPFDDVGCVFPAVGFLCDVERDALKEIGAFYERLDRRAGTARNGQPMFTTVQFIHREDWLLARDMIAAEIVRREGV